VYLIINFIKVNEIFSIYNWKSMYFTAYKPCRRHTYFCRIPPGPVWGLSPLWTDVQQPVVAEVSCAFNAFGLDAPAVLLPLPQLICVSRGVQNAHATRAQCQIVMNGDIICVSGQKWLSVSRSMVSCL